MAGNILQQFYNLADTLIVSRCIGTEALAAGFSRTSRESCCTEEFLRKRKESIPQHFRQENYKYT